MPEIKAGFVSQTGNFAALFISVIGDLCIAVACHKSNYKSPDDRLPPKAFFWVVDGTFFSGSYVEDKWLNRMNQKTVSSILLQQTANFWDEFASVSFQLVEDPTSDKN